MLLPGKLKLGRGSECDIRLDNFRVSRVHAVLSVSESALQIQDCESSNGVWINGRRVEDTASLRPGDRVSIGGVEARILRGDSLHPGFADATTRPMSMIPIAAIAPDSEVPPSPLEVLSPREREVLSLFAAGFDQREIAAHLDLSVKTIETYRARIGDKIGIRSRAEMVRLALDAGLLRPG